MSISYAAMCKHLSSKEWRKQMEISRVNVKPVYRMELTEEDKQWLKGYLQHSNVHHSKESEHDTKMRTKFFGALMTA